MTSSNYWGKISPRKDKIQAAGSSMVTLTPRALHGPVPRAMSVPPPSRVLPSFAFEGTSPILEGVSPEEEDQMLQIRGSVMTSGRIMDKDRD
ncbi:unnamed protein product [Taenia asiatica]|uniref:Uncharacterized protein n=1 Tax=Taenia asiatica TaxID=60517 RepID=A0A0R3VSU7_TAEAS|nr:unnamed protein product [Taenia asiatica]